MKFVSVFILMTIQGWALAAGQPESGTYYPAGDPFSNCLLDLGVASGQSLVSATLIQNPKVPSKLCGVWSTVIFQYDARLGRYYSQIVKERYKYDRDYERVVDFYYQYDLNKVNESSILIVKNKCTKDSSNNYICKQFVSQLTWQKVEP